MLMRHLLKTNLEFLEMPYNKKNGWYTNWDQLIDDNEVYALVVEGSVDIQGLVSNAKNIREVYTYDWTDEKL